MCGGKGRWVEEVKLYDDQSAEELQTKTDKFLNDKCSGYRTNIKIDEIVRI